MKHAIMIQACCSNGVLKSAFLTGALLGNLLASLGVAACIAWAKFMRRRKG